MGKIISISTGVIVTILKVLFLALICGTIMLGIATIDGIDIVTLIVIAIYCFLIVGLYKIIKLSNVKTYYKVILLLIIGTVMRTIWIINIDTVPYSDFQTLYNAAIELSNNDNTIFTGVNYIARFPHLSYMIVYMSFIIKVFGEGLFAIKVGNLILSIISMFLIYKLVSEVFESKKKGLNALAISVVFTPLVSYVGVLATENIAIPFYLASVYCFVKAIKNKLHIGYLLGCGVLLGVGNLFRMVAIVMVIAYIMYIFIFENSMLLIKIKSSIIIFTMFCLVVILGSAALKLSGITEVHLWKGRESAVTNILKGTNLNSFGRFTEEDAAIPGKYNYDYDKVKEESLSIIKERLTTTPPIKLAVFYSGKFVGQWVQGEMSGISWSESGAEHIGIVNSNNFKFVSQLIYIIIIILSFISLFNKKQIYKENPIINLFYIILCGYGSFYIISEMQGRYAYIVCWLFIIFAVSGIDKLKAVRNNKERIY